MDNDGCSPLIILPHARKTSDVLIDRPSHRDTFFLTEMVHLTHHDSTSAPASPTLDHFHRDRCTNLPEYAIVRVTRVVLPYCLEVIPKLFEDRSWRKPHEPERCRFLRNV